MISFLEGKIEYLGDKYVILNAGGIGYRVYITPRVRNILAKNQEKVNAITSENQLRTPEASDGISAPTARLFVHSQMNLREGTFDLYGFESKEDLELFNLLISISGIGPKNALHILSTVEPSHLKAAVINEDADYLKKVSGLGPKTAQRLILELQNKVDHIDIGGLGGANLTEESQAVDALMVLGYSQSQAKDALKTVSQDKRLEERVREALKILGKN